MRYFIASDIHGSEYYCKKMIEAYEREMADRMLLLGDILYHGPRNDLPKDYNTKSVFAMLNEYKDEIVCVRGNCDAEVDQWVLDFPMLDEYRQIKYKDTTIYLAHGHKQCLPELSKGDIVLSGHTHVPKYEIYENYTYINPGSVSIPKEESWHGYILLDNGVFIWKDFEGGEHLRFESWE